VGGRVGCRIDGFQPVDVDAVECGSDWSDDGPFFYGGFRDEGGEETHGDERDLDPAAVVSDDDVAPSYGLLGGFRPCDVDVHEPKNEELPTDPDVHDNCEESAGGAL